MVKEKHKYRTKDLVFCIVKKIPAGSITSYGRIGKLLNISPRVIGFILSGMNQEEMKTIPWQRVVNKVGFISSIKLGDKGYIQAEILRIEGITIKEFQIVEPEKYWYEFELIYDKEFRKKIKYFFE